MMRIVSWNVNGIRKYVRDSGALAQLFNKHAADIMCLQETRVNPPSLTSDLLHVPGYESFWTWNKERPGHCGVATYVKTGLTKDFHPDLLDGGLDVEGRVVSTDHGAFVLLNCYFPYAGMETRLPVKMEFNRQVEKRCQELRAAGREVIVAGDFNVAHRDLDVYDTKKVSNLACFLPVEREWFESFLKAGFVDTYRLFNPSEPGFTAWDMRDAAARAANRGWRIDYILASPGIAKSIVGAACVPSQLSSDHCPVAITLKAPPTLTPPLPATTREGYSGVLARKYNIRVPDPNAQEEDDEEDAPSPAGAPAGSKVILPGGRGVLGGGALSPRGGVGFVGAGAGAFARGERSQQRDTSAGESSSMFPSLSQGLARRQRETSADTTPAPAEAEDAARRNVRSSRRSDAAASATPAVPDKPDRDASGPVDADATAGSSSRSSRKRSASPAGDATDATAASTTDDATASRSPRVPRTQQADANGTPVEGASDEIDGAGRSRARGARTGRQGAPGMDASASDTAGANDDTRRTRRGGAADGDRATDAGAGAGSSGPEAGVGRTLEEVARENETLRVKMAMLENDNRLLRAKLERIRREVKE